MKWKLLSAWYHRQGGRQKSTCASKADCFSPCIPIHCSKQSWHIFADCQQSEKAVDRAQDEEIMAHA